MFHWMTLATALLAAPARETTKAPCGMFPDSVYETVIYDEFLDCMLKREAEQPLWRGIKRKNIRQQIRFTFVQGLVNYSQIINFVERTDGTGRITLKTVRYDGGHYVRRSPDISIYEDLYPWVSNWRSRRVSTGDVATLNRLVDASGNWDPSSPVGSWDGDKVFVDCETLYMERISPQGYGFGEVTFSCNQPVLLTPLVRFITGLVGLKSFYDGRMY